MVSGVTPDVRRRRQNLAVAVALLVLLIAFTWVQTAFFPLRLVRVLIGLNVILVLLLLLLIFRNVIKLLFEGERRGVSGFRVKILIAFVSLSLFPSILLFLAGSNLISQSISNLFTPSVEQIKDAAFFIARSSTNQEWERNSRFAESVSEEIRTGHLLAIQHSAELEELVRRKVTEYGLAMIQVYTARGDLLAESANPDTPLGTGGVGETEQRG
jgi:two-component system nitrogen regulation sensor histidine kinase NtrY